MEFIAPQWRACVKFLQSGVIKLYTRHMRSFWAGQRTLGFFFCYLCSNSSPATHNKMLLCTRVVCRGNVRPGSLKKKKEREEKGRAHVTQDVSSGWIPRVVVDENSTAFSTRPSLIRSGRSINLDLCLNPTIWLSTTTATSSSLLCLLNLSLLLLRI